MVETPKEKKRFLEISQLMSNRDACVLIITPKDRIKGLIMNPFSFSGNADFGTVGMMGLQQKAGEMMSKTAATLGVGQQIRLEAFKNTLATYQGTAKPPINVSFTVVAVRPDDDVRGVVTALFKGVFPSNKAGMVMPPFDLADEDPTKLCAVSIGRWFATTRALVIKNVDPSFSKEVTPKGLPLYVQVNVALECFKLPTADEVAGWFLKAPTKPTGSFEVKWST